MNRLQLSSARKQSDLSITVIGLL
eukprot:COSAG05_NODE_10664_length_553_cov_0.647577_2_plen_23_part_01